MRAEGRVLIALRYPESIGNIPKYTGIPTCTMDSSNFELPVERLVGAVLSWRSRFRAFVVNGI